MDVGNTSRITPSVTAAGAVHAQNSAAPSTGASEAQELSRASLKDGDQIELSTQGRQMSALYSRTSKDSSSLSKGGNTASNAPDPTQTQDPYGDPARVEDVDLEKLRERVLQEIKRQDDAADMVGQEGNISDYEKERLARLDHIALLIDEGKYHVDNFMVDRIAVELAKSMS